MRQFADYLNDTDPQLYHKLTEGEGSRVLASIFGGGGAGALAGGLLGGPLGATVGGYLGTKLAGRYLPHKGVLDARFNMKKKQRKQMRTR